MRDHPPDAEDAERLLETADRLSVTTPADRRLHSAAILAGGFGIAGIAVAGSFGTEHFVQLLGAVAIALIMDGVSDYYVRTRSHSAPRGMRRTVRVTTAVGFLMLVVGQLVTARVDGGALAAAILVCAVMAPFAIGAARIGRTSTSKELR